MLRFLLPRIHRRLFSLPLLGPIADSFDDWLASNGYTQISRKHVLRDLPHLDAELRRHQIKEISNLTVGVLHDCCESFIPKHRRRAGRVRTLQRYLAENNLIVPGQSVTATSTGSILIEEYAHFLREARGLVAPTISQHQHAARCFLQQLDREGIRLKKIKPIHIESYIARAGKRLSRATLQHEISAVRGFLRFLALDGRAPDGLGSQIDTPRLYRFEKVPRSLSWETVQALLRSIDRTSATGLRDYAIFLLIATYGLRSSEVVAITLDDLHWAQGCLRIHQRKTASPLELPLTNEVSCALVKHLERTPPAPYRRIFLRMYAPIGALKPTAINAAFRFLVRKSGLRIPFQGPHCLRHSLAAHLLQKGTPLKTIGDILGHRSAESTSMYLRLATADLREVALGIPRRDKEGQC
jgi:integrase/recombinase XerD